MTPYGIPMVDCATVGEIFGETWVDQTTPSQYRSWLGSCGSSYHPACCVMGIPSHEVATSHAKTGRQAAQVSTYPLRPSTVLCTRPLMTRPLRNPGKGRLWWIVRSNVTSVLLRPRLRSV